MNWIISANSSIYDHSSSFEHYGYIDWRQGNVNFEINDIIYIYCTKPIQKIQYKCRIEKINLNFRDIRDDKEYWKDMYEYEKSLSGKFIRLRLVEQVSSEKLHLSNLQRNGLNSAPQGPVKINQQLLKYLEANFSDNYQPDIFPEMVNEEIVEYEGLKKKIVVNKYERSSIARNKCIEFHGLNCKVCDINFLAKYGEIGKDFIHIHHLVPIHKIGKEYKIDYKNDLIPVCPNCHAMLHRKINGAEPTIEELRKLLK